MFQEEILAATIAPHYYEQDPWECPGLRSMLEKECLKPLSFVGFDSVALSWRVGFELREILVPSWLRMFSGPVAIHSGDREFRAAYPIPREGRVLFSKCVVSGLSLLQNHSETLVAAAIQNTLVTLLRDYLSQTLYSAEPRCSKCGAAAVWIGGFDALFACHAHRAAVVEELYTDLYAPAYHKPTMRMLWTARLNLFSGRWHEEEADRQISVFEVMI